MGNVPVIRNGIDFTEDMLIDTGGSAGGQTAINTFVDEKEKMATKPPALATTTAAVEEKKPVEKDKTAAPAVNEYKNPIMSLNELKPGLVYECSETGSTAATKRFKTTVVVDGRTFEGSGSSKKFAKQACARAALSKLYGVSFTPTHAHPEKTTAEKVVAGTGIPLSKFSIDQEVADNVARLILEKFDGLTVGNMVAARRKVIAGIVMSRGEDMSRLTIVSVTTGTKCINGEYMSVSGNGLNDCHAEILSRRCLMRFLYSQLEKMGQQGGAEEEECILEPGDKGGYRLKADVRFHLYINTAPCGDARIFSPHEDKRGILFYSPHFFSISLLQTNYYSGHFLVFCSK